MKSYVHQSEGAESRPDSKSNDKDDLQSLPLPELEEKLGSLPDGLSQDEAQRRLTRYGCNEIVEQQISPWLKFFTYFWGPIPWMIEAVVFPRRCQQVLPSGKVKRCAA